MFLWYLCWRGLVSGCAEVKCNKYITFCEREYKFQETVVLAGMISFGRLNHSLQHDRKYLWNGQLVWNDLCTTSSLRGKCKSSSKSLKIYSGQYWWTSSSTNRDCPRVNRFSAWLRIFPSPTNWLPEGNLNSSRDPISKRSFQWLPKKPGKWNR